MKKNALHTPAILVDLDVLEANIRAFQTLCTEHGKQLWPMIKTHKSTEITRMQHEAGASGFLCGTLDECEALCRLGFENIMYAYPVAAGPSAARAAELARHGNFILRLDCADNAHELNDAARAAGVSLNYTVIIDSGLHRFGMEPEQAPAFVSQLRPLDRLVFKGISTHPGHVYGGSGATAVEAGAADEARSLAAAKHCLLEAGLECEIVSSGSTPTFSRVVGGADLTHLHPGNYVFQDMIQCSLEVVTPSACSLSVLATVISRPAPDRLIIDAGTKCFGLDQGAHGGGTLKGFGLIKGHPDLEIYGLSEEVGKVRVPAASPLKVGDRIEIIPNHACSSANLTSYYIGCRGEDVERLIPVDIRSNATRCGA